MRKSFWLAAALAVVGLSFAAPVPSAAAPASNPNFCGGTDHCWSDTFAYPGGTFYVDVDVTGANQNATVQAYDNSGPIAGCRWTIAVSDPARTFACPLQKGPRNVSGLVSAPSTLPHDFRIGVHW